MSMTKLEILCIVVGALCYLIAAIWVTILAFRRSVSWGLGCVFFPPLTLLYVILYHPDLRFPLLFKLWGVALVLLGVEGLVYWHPGTTNTRPTAAHRAGTKINRRDLASHHVSPNP